MATTLMKETKSYQRWYSFLKRVKKPGLKMTQYTSDLYKCIIPAQGRFDINREVWS